jgi:hypothetical protein
MLSDSHVSEPKISVGLHDSIIWSSSDFLFLIDWKFIVSTLSGDVLSILELFDLKVCLCIGKDWWDIFGSETWLSDNISPYEYFDPTKYTVYSKNRKDGYGGVLIAISNEYITSQVTELDTNCELVWYVYICFITHSA